MCACERVCLCVNVCVCVCVCDADSDQYVASNTAIAGASLNGSLCGSTYTNKSVVCVGEEGGMRRPGLGWLCVRVCVCVMLTMISTWPYRRDQCVWQHLYLGSVVCVGEEG